MSTLSWTEATPADEEVILALIEAFYAGERIEFRAEPVRAAVREMLGEPQRVGRIFLLADVLKPAPPAGYMSASFCHSLEFGGRFVLLDDFYLTPAVRGRGWAKRSLDFLAAWARAAGAHAVRLEVNHHNTRAKGIYLKAGFSDDRRETMTLVL